MQMYGDSGPTVLRLFGIFTPNPGEVMKPN